MAIKYNGTAPERRALGAFVALQRAAESLSQRLLPAITAVGLSESQFGVLEALYHLGPMCQRDIARKVLKSNANMTTVIDNLEKRSLVQRTRSKGDRRYYQVILAPEGKRLIEEFLPEHVDAICREMAILSVKEQETLKNLCRAVGKQTKDKGRTS